MTKSNPLPFLKMHGLGNDFVVIDSRKHEFTPSPHFFRAVANRRRGVGCDQVIVLREADSSQANVHMAIYNKDGSQARACDNATRCIARLMFAELGRATCVVETIAGLLPTWQETPQWVAVDFGPPNLEWQQIPLARDVDTLHVPVASGGLFDPCCVNVGNPHAVFFVDDVNEIALGEVGPHLETDPLFPDRCNIEIAQIIAPDRIRMRVWERGAGITGACGSGASATLVAAARRGVSARRATIILDGGELVVEWREDNHVILIGPDALSFSGTLPEGFGDE